MPTGADQYRPTEYGRTNWMEDFAAAGKINIADRYLCGGVGSITAQWSTIQNQYKTYENCFADLDASDKTCL